MAQPPKGGLVRGRDKPIHGIQRLLLSRCYKWMQHDAGNFWAICCWHRAFFGVAGLKWPMKMMVALGAWVPDPEHLRSLWNFVSPKKSRSQWWVPNLGSIYITPSNLWCCLRHFLDAGSFFIPVSSFHSLFWMFWGSLPFWEDFNSRDCANTTHLDLLDLTDFDWLTGHHWPKDI